VALKTFLNGIDDIKQGKRDSVKIWIVAPSYELTQKVFEYFVKWILKIYPDMGQFVQNKPFPQLKVSEGIWVQCKSTENPTSLLGEELDLVIIDEAARVSRRVYDTYIFPTTSSRQARTFFISTPFGQNWFYEKWIDCKNNKDGSSFQFKTNDNPFWTVAKNQKAEWERTKQKLPLQVFEQEYMASFLPDAAAVFRGVDDIIKKDALSDVIADHKYVMGVDIAKHEDFTVLTVIDKYNNNVVYCDRFSQIDYPFQKKRILATSRRYNNARIIVDSTGVGEPIKDDLSREGMFVDDFGFTNKSKKELIEKLSIFIEQKNVWIPRMETMIDELKSYGYRLSDAGNIIYGAPHGLHDDHVVSLALAVWGLVGKASPKTAIQVELQKRRRQKPRTSFI